jgi:hypothetical protein
VPLRSLNSRQGVIIVVGLAFALHWVGRWIISAGSTDGWIAYAPLSGASSGAPFLLTHPWAQLLIWFGLVLAWVVASLLIIEMDTSPIRSRSPPTDPPICPPNGVTHFSRQGYTASLRDLWMILTAL